MTNRIFRGLFFVMLFFSSCSGGGDKKVAKSSTSPEVNEEVVIEMPKEQISGDGIDSKLAEKGKSIFKLKCAVCHAMNKRLIGPPLLGVTQKRTDEWILKMILDPADMLKNDPEAKKLLKEYNNVPMTPSGVNEEEALSILEYFKQADL